MHTPQSLADVLERDYFPMPDGAKLYLAEHEWRMVIAALRASPPEAPSEGWKLVPVEPTDKMEDAANAAAEIGGDASGNYFKDIYRAMLDAAPGRSSRP